MEWMTLEAFSSPNHPLMLCPGFACSAGCQVWSKGWCQWPGWISDPVWAQLGPPQEELPRAGGLGPEQKRLHLSSTVKPKHESAPPEAHSRAQLSTPRCSQHHPCSPSPPCSGLQPFRGFTPSSAGHIPVGWRSCGAGSGLLLPALPALGGSGRRAVVRGREANSPWPNPALCLWAGWLCWGQPPQSFSSKLPPLQ